MVCHFVETVNEIRVRFHFHFPDEIKSCASHLSCIYVCVCFCVCIVPCSVFVVAVAQNPLLIFVSCLSISYVLLQRPFFMLNLFSPFDEFLFLTFFAFSLSSIFSWFVFLPLSLLRNVMSLFSHFVGDYLSISATFRRILNSDDDKYSHEL